MKRNSSIILLTVTTLMLLAAVAYFMTGPAGGDKSSKPKSGVECKEFTGKVDPEDGERIDTVITTMANTSLIGLAFKSSQLHKLGDILDKHVPPFEFLGYIFSHPKLAKAMTEIKQSRMKYDNFVDGLKKGLLKEYESGCFFYRAKGFAKYLNLNEEKTLLVLKKCVEAAKTSKSKTAFKPFVDYLIKEKRAAKSK